MSNLKNNQYSMRVHGIRNGNRETLILTFSSRPVAMAAYRAMPDEVSCSFPARVETAVYRDSLQAVHSARDFFNISGA